MQNRQSENNAENRKKHKMKTLDNYTMILHLPLSHRFNTETEIANLAKVKELAEKERGMTVFNTSIKYFDRTNGVEVLFTAIGEVSNA